jgi:dCMP deaminase
MDWNDYYMTGAHWVRTKSKDLHTKVGCIIIGPDHEIRSTGYNGLPRGCTDSPIPYPERHDRTKDKYSWYAHAEENAIANAARMGTPLKGCVAYITALPCANCSRLLVNTGMDEVYWAMDPSFVSTPDRAASFEKNLKTSKTMLSEGGVALRQLTSTVDNVWTVLAR